MKKNKDKKKALGIFPPMNNKGQLDVIGNILELIKSQKWLLPIIFLLLLIVVSFELDFAGTKISVTSVLNSILKPLLAAVGITFDFKMFVIICFLGVIVSFIMTKGWGFIK